MQQAARCPVPPQPRHSTRTPRGVPRSRPDPCTQPALCRPLPSPRPCCHQHRDPLTQRSLAGTGVLSPLDGPTAHTTETSAWERAHQRTRGTRHGAQHQRERNKDSERGREATGVNQEERNVPTKPAQGEAALSQGRDKKGQEGPSASPAARFSPTDSPAASHPCLTNSLCNHFSTPGFGKSCLQLTLV